ncbi:MAG: restriction endonuclease [Pirellulales bacterium]
MPGRWPGTSGDDDVDDAIDLERVALDEIAARILAKFKGHGLARLIDAILRAQGFRTFVSPEGPDNSIDILASAGPMGFDAPRICVQVKSGEGQVDAPTLQQLVGAIDKVGATHGLLVSWGVFKSSLERKQRRDQFLCVQLWNQYDVVAQFLDCYDRIESEFRSEIPLKQIWTVVDDDET